MYCVKYQNMPDTDVGQISLFSMHYDRCKSPFEFIHLENLFNLFPLEIVQKVNIANFVKMQVRWGNSIALLFTYSYKALSGYARALHSVAPFLSVLKCLLLIFQKGKM